MYNHNKSDLNTDYFSFTKNEAKREATVFIYGGIGDYDPDTFEVINTASKFRAEFENATRDADTIHVRINSPGGYIFEGLAIYNVIFGAEKKVITYNDGLCASMSALILLSGDEIHAYKNSLLMLHNCSGVAWGNVQQLEEQIEAQKKMDLSLSTAIEERLGITAEEVSEKYLNYKDNWYDSQEALDLGFYDEIIQKEKQNNLPEDIKNMSASTIHKKYAAYFRKGMRTKVNSKTRKMAKSNDFPLLQNALGLDGPLASNEEKGSYLNETQKHLIENAISGLKSDNKLLKDEHSASLKKLNEEKEELDRKIEAFKNAQTEALDLLKQTAKKAGIEEIPEEASLESLNELITDQIAELNKQPGANHTQAGENQSDDNDKQYAYLNFSASIYDDYNKRKNQ